jgi:hypothetical protein
VFVANTKLSAADSSMVTACAAPNLSGDKGRDAIAHRAALRRCEAKRKSWQDIYASVQQNLGRAADD